MNMNEIAVAKEVRRWQAEGRWVDHGQWVRGNRCSREYHPTQQEIAAKCSLFRTRPGRHGAHARAPRGGEFAIPTLAGI